MTCRTTVRWEEGWADPRGAHPQPCPRGRTHCCGACMATHKPEDPKTSPDVHFPYTECCFQHLAVQRGVIPRTNTLKAQLLKEKEGFPWRSSGWDFAF